MCVTLYLAVLALESMPIFAGFGWLRTRWPKLTEKMSRHSPLRALPGDCRPGPFDAAPILFGRTVWCPEVPSTLVSPGYIRPVHHLRHCWWYGVDCLRLHALGAFDAEGECKQCDPGSGFNYHWLGSGGLSLLSFLGCIGHDLYL